MVYAVGTVLFSGWPLPVIQPIHPNISYCIVNLLPIGQSIEFMEFSDGGDTVVAEKSRVLTCDSG